MPLLALALVYSATILNIFKFEKFAYGTLVHAWTTSHLQKNETAITEKFIHNDVRAKM